MGITKTRRLVKLRDQAHIAMAETERLAFNEAMSASSRAWRLAIGQVNEVRQELYDLMDTVEKMLEVYIPSDDEVFRLDHHDEELKKLFVLNSGLQDKYPKWGVSKNDN